MSEMSITWERFDRDARALAVLAAPLGPFTGIVAVSRGGLVPAAIVARIMDIRLLETVCVMSYDGQARSRPFLIKRPAAAVDDRGRGWLVIDDLVDSGATAQAVRDLLPEARYAAVYAKPAGRPFADIAAVPVEQDIWLVFPWEAS